MGRPRAGSGWTDVITPKGRRLRLICLDNGDWVPSGRAKGWPRCSRCRAPFEKHTPEQALCRSCDRTFVSEPHLETWEKLGEARKRYGARPHVTVGDLLAARTPLPSFGEENLVDLVNTALSDGTLVPAPSDFAWMAKHPDTLALRRAMLDASE